MLSFMRNLCQNWFFCWMKLKIPLHFLIPVLCVIFLGIHTVSEQLEWQILKESDLVPWIPLTQYTRTYSEILQPLQVVDKILLVIDWGLNDHEVMPSFRQGGNNIWLHEVEISSIEIKVQGPLPALHLLNNRLLFSWLCHFSFPNQISHWYLV